MLTGRGLAVPSRGSRVLPPPDRGVELALREELGGARAGLGLPAPLLEDALVPQRYPSRCRGFKLSYQKGQKPNSEQEQLSHKNPLPWHRVLRCQRHQART